MATFIPVEPFDIVILAARVIYPGENLCGREIVDTFIVTFVIVMFHEVFDLSFEIAGQEVML